MPTFELEINGRRFEMEAPSADVAADYARRIGSVTNLRGRDLNREALLEARGRVDRGEPPPDFGPPPQSDLSYRLGRAGDLATNVGRSALSGVPVVGGLAERAFGQSDSYDQFKAEHPIMSQVIPVAGGVASMVPMVAAAPAAFGVGGASLGARALAGAATGGAIGAADAASRGTNIGTGGIIGAGTGALGPAIGAGIGRVLGGAAARSASPSLQQLRTAANAAYDAMDNAGVVVPPATVQRLKAQLLTELQAAHYQPPLHREITNGLRVVDQMARNPVSLRDLDGLRQALRDIGGTAPNNQGRLSRVMVRALDGFVDRLGPADVTAGNSQAGVAALTEARGLWHNMSKGEVIEAVIDRARNAPPTQSWTLALRTQFRTLANDVDEMRLFSPAEQDAIRRVVRGDRIESALDIIGKISPRTLHGAIMGTAAGGAAGGFLGAGVAPMVGEAGRAASGALTRNNAAIASAMARSGPAYGQTAARVGGQRGRQAARIAQQLMIPTVPRAVSEYE